MTRDEKIELGVTVGSLAAFLLGWRRLAGSITLANGAFYYSKSKVVGIAKLAIGGAFLLWPEWPESVSSAIKGIGTGASNPNKSLPPQNQPPTLPSPIELNMPPTRYISLPSLDRNLDGNWTLLDVRDLQSQAVKNKAPILKPGDVVSLIMQQPGGPYLVFSAKVTGGSAQTMYQGQWMSKPPTGGPATPEFGREHVYAVS